MPSYLPSQGGYGMNTRGAWGGSVTPTIEHVTNTDDSGAGSLRAALEGDQPPRVVLIETSGECHLTSRLLITSPYVTIAGQCAPSPGFIVSGYGLEVVTHDVVCQYFGILPGEFGFMEDENSSFQTYGQAYNVIADHMTLMWGPDETAAVITEAGEANTTFIDCLIAEGLQMPTSVPTSDSHAALVTSGSKRVAWVRCLIASSKERCGPYWQDDSSTAVVNCLLYNWQENWSFFGSNASYASSPDGGPGFRGYQVSLVNNCQIPGPNTVDAYEVFLQNRDFGQGAGNNRVYVTGTLVTNPLAVPEEGVVSQLTYNPFVSVPPPNAPLDGFSIMDEADVEAYVTAHAGMRPVDRIAQLDGRVVADVRNRTWALSPAWVTHQDDVGGYPTLAENYVAFTIPANPHDYTGDYTNLEIALQTAAAALDLSSGGGPIDEVGDATNITPETARAITALPYSVTLAAGDLEPVGAGVDYPSTCDTDQRRALWWSYTTRPNEYVLTLSAKSTDEGIGDYSPYLSIWSGTLGSLTQYRLTTGSEPNDFCNLTGDGFWMSNVPVEPNTTYYFQVTDANSNPTLSTGLVFEVRGNPRASVPAGSILINDDADGYRAAVLSATTGEFLRYVPYPAGEFADTQPTGEVAAQGSFDAVSVKFFDGELNEVADVSVATATSVRAIKSDRSGNFYVVTADDVGNGRHVEKYTAAGVSVYAKDLPSDFDSTTIFAVSRDGIYLYATKASSSDIWVYNLGTDTQESTLVVAVVGQSFKGFGDGYVARDGSILFMRTDSSTVWIDRFDPSTGDVLQTYTPTSITYGQHFAMDSDDEDAESLMIWGYISPFTNGPAYFERIALSDGSSLSEVGPITVTGNSGDVTEGPYAISNSCPLLRLSAPLADLDVDTSDIAFEDYIPDPLAIPVPTPLAPQTPCPPQAQTTNGGKGAAGCNTGGVNPRPTYTGPWGDVPDHADPDPGETLTGKNGKGVEIWIEINRLTYPAGDAEQILRAMVPLPDPSDYEGGYKTDGLQAIGHIEHALGNERGGFEAATVDISLFDTDPRTFRVIADDQELEGAELFVKMASDEARA